MSKRVLVVDDDEKIRTVVSNYLSEEGYEVVTAADPDSALFTAHVQTPDVIILDVLLPTMDGFDLCTMLQGHPDTRDIPIIFLTGTSDPLGRLKAKYAGGSDYVTKPFKRSELIGALERLAEAGAF